MKTGSVPTRGVRHPMRVVTYARELSAAGWRNADIARLLEREGVSVSRATVGRWVSEDVQKRVDRNGAAARVRRAEARARLPRCTGRAPLPEYRFERMRALRQVGLSFSSIAKVMTFDFPDLPIDEEGVRRIIRDGVFPHHWKRALAA